ncbi:unnamed protein product [Bemisia tabaci]|uniref:Uncharacterized protein n=1 Tax=Bemisia tabaci TaxID=7038 RepID=A0A9P0CD21_BEMTA|nr:unnamed protein product [Bemisia tabaci]
MELRFVVRGHLCFFLLIFLCKEFAGMKGNDPGSPRNLRSPGSPRSSRSSSSLSSSSSLRSPSRRRSLGLVGSVLSFDKGDAIITSWIPNSYGVHRPFQWMYAIDKNNVMVFQPTSCFRLRCVIRPAIVNLREEYPDVLMINLGKLPGHIGAPGVLLAAAMLLDEKKPRFHYSAFYCNSRHYVEYLSTGKVTGTFPSLLTMDSLCPLTAPLIPAMGVKFSYIGKFRMKPAQGPEIKLSMKRLPEWATFLDYAKPEKPYIDIRYDIEDSLP